MYVIPVFYVEESGIIKYKFLTLDIQAKIVKSLSISLIYHYYELFCSGKQPTTLGIYSVTEATAHRLRRDTTIIQPLYRLIDSND